MKIEHRMALDHVILDIENWDKSFTTTETEEFQLLPLTSRHPCQFYPSPLHGWGWGIVTSPSRISSTLPTSSLPSPWLRLRNCDFALLHLVNLVNSFSSASPHHYQFPPVSPRHCQCTSPAYLDRECFVPRQDPPHIRETRRYFFPSAESILGRERFGRRSIKPLPLWFRRREERSWGLLQKHQPYTECLSLCAGKQILGLGSWNRVVAIRTHPF